MTSGGRRAVAGLLTCALAFGALAAVGGQLASAQGHTYFVAHGGTAATCDEARSPSTPFDTVEKALACTADGDVVSLAPSGSKPYPGVGTVSHSVAIVARGGDDARSVAIDVSADAGRLTVAAGADVAVRNVSVVCANALPPRLATCSPAVTNLGTLTLTGVAVAGGPSTGAAIENTSRLTLLESTVSGNTNTHSDGGGIESMAAGASSPAPALTVANSTIANNTAAGHNGGGIAVDQGSATLTNDTIAGNSATGAGVGGGIFVPSVPPVTVRVSNTLLAANTSSSSSGPDCAHRLFDGPGGHNLIGDGTGCIGITDGSAGDRVGTASAHVNPVLGPFADYGGPTRTMALRPTSPAIGAADGPTCSTTPVSDRDQRGDSRHVATRALCDVGAFDTGGGGGVAHATYLVAPGGTAAKCEEARSPSSTPFDTIQDALACTVDGDVVSLAASRGTLYRGIGTVTHSVAIVARAGEDARSVAVDVSPDPGPLTVAAGAEVAVRDVSLVCEVAQRSPPGSCFPDVTNKGSLTLWRDTVTGGPSDGAAIESASTTTSQARLTVLASTVNGNTNRRSDGGGIASTTEGASSPAPVLAVANSTIANNTAAGGHNGGGIAIDQGSAALINDTLSDNFTNVFGGGIFAAPDPSVTARVGNTVVAGNGSSSPEGGPDCDGRLLDGPGGHNLIGDGTNCTGISNGVNGDQVGTRAMPIDARLGVLAPAGGPTDTIPLESGSPAISAAAASTCDAPPVSQRDQRGDSRQAANRGGCDVGSYDTDDTHTLQVTTTSLPQGQLGQAYSATLARIGGTGPFVWSLRSGSLPHGLSLSPTGTVSGTPW